MSSTVTMKKLIEANKWLANIKSNEKELRFIMGKKTTSVYVNFYLRSERIYNKFKKLVEKNEKELLSQGWDVGISRLSYCSKDIFVMAIPSENVSCVELKFVFSIYEDGLEEINSKIDFITKTLTFFTENLGEVKNTMDIKYYVENTFNIPETSLRDKITFLGYEQKRNLKSAYRRFEIKNKHNITSGVTLKEFDNYTDLGISIDVENIIIDDKSLTQELQFSLYYYIIEYYKIHYNIVNNTSPEYVEKHKDFYNKVNSKI